MSSQKTEPNNGPGRMGSVSPRASARRPEPVRSAAPSLLAQALVARSRVGWAPSLLAQALVARSRGGRVRCSTRCIPRSFADSNGDGVGDLDGLTARLDYLVQLGVDAIWLNPVAVSPMADHGYDVADPRDVDPLFGGLSALERLIAAAHQRGIKLTMDLVPNHTSSAHPWFRAALAAGPASAARERYIFRDGRGPGGSKPPNNWVSVFGGPAWTQITEPDDNPGQWYLHLFDGEQPDLNWDNPEVFDDFEALRFWLDCGVDGFPASTSPTGWPSLPACRTWHPSRTCCCATGMTTFGSTTRTCTRFTATSAR